MENPKCDNRTSPGRGTVSAGYSCRFPCRNNRTPLDFPENRDLPITKNGGTCPEERGVSIGTLCPRAGVGRQLRVNKTTASPFTDGMSPPNPTGRRSWLITMLFEVAAVPTDAMQTIHKLRSRSRRCRPPADFPEQPELRPGSESLHSLMGLVTRTWFPEGGKDVFVSKVRARRSGPTQDRPAGSADLRPVPDH